MTPEEKSKKVERLRALNERIFEHGEESEIVNITLNISLKGKSAIRYQICREFSDSSDEELLNLILQLGLQESVTLANRVAMINGIIL